jgi:hypothetical protein
MYDSLFVVFEIAEHGEAIPPEADQTLKVIMARVIGLRDRFSGDYMIVSQATGRRIRFTAKGDITRT